MNEKTLKALNLLAAAFCLLGLAGDGKASSRAVNAGFAVVKSPAFRDLSDDIIGTWQLDGDAANRFTFGEDGRFSNEADGKSETGTYRIFDADGILETKIERGTARFKVRITNDTLFISVGNDELIYKRVRSRDSGRVLSAGASNRRGAAADDVDLSSPTKAFALYYQAVEDRDTNLFRRVASKRMLDSMADGAAKQQKKFDDEFIRAFLDKLASKIGKTPEIRNEKISDDAATLEEKLASGWREVACVKEKGAWKYDSFY